MHLLGDQLTDGPQSPRCTQETGYRTFLDSALLERLTVCRHSPAPYNRSPAFDAASPKRSRSSRLSLHATSLFYQPTGVPNLHTMRRLEHGQTSHNTSVACSALDSRRCNNFASFNTTLGNPDKCTRLIFLDLRSSGGALCGDSTIHPHSIC